ncbi:hypothetical protein DNHGIG_35720 [Collibacillus ludicampi]|uniref:Uncharacterized protein n=1 Tax=Collibacillus ludicampi TaxID=2771369 RepID=A0AAV4LJL6_9BACL|nr:hypothetical protein DNHGIG_35720 [Collibacillus ludicampi]
MFFRLGAPKHRFAADAAVSRRLAKCETERPTYRVVIKTGPVTGIAYRLNPAANPCFIHAKKMLDVGEEKGPSLNPQPISVAGRMSGFSGAVFVAYRMAEAVINRQDFDSVAVKEGNFLRGETG